MFKVADAIIYPKEKTKKGRHLMAKTTEKKVASKTVAK